MRPVPGSPGGRGRELGEKQIEALTVALILAPGVYVRNRMFDLLSSQAARRARMRAATVRGLLPHLARATALSVASESRAGESCFVLRYAIAAVRLTRVVELSAVELAALRVVAERANLRVLPVGAADGELVARALARLLDPDVGDDVVRLARDIVAPPAGE